MHKIKNYFSKMDIALWSSSVIIIILSSVFFGEENYLTLCASLIGITSLIFCAKGNPIGQILMIVFSLFYGIISYAFTYYGEMVTYLGMTLPMSVFALVSWLKNPFGNNRAEVKVSEITKKDMVHMCVLTVLVTGVLYLILAKLNTANLIPSTLSVATSFVAVYLTYKRSPYYALAYALNDIVLILMWILASIEDIRYVSVVVCFVAFLANDLYGYICWQKMKKRQKAIINNKL